MFDKAFDFKKSLYVNLGILAAIILVFVSFSYLLRMSVDHQVSVIQDINSKKSFVSDSSNNLSILIKQWNFVRNYVQQISLMVPSKDNLVNFQRDLNDISQRDGVSLTFSFGSETPSSGAGNLGSIGFSSVINGTQQGILNFIQDVENKYYSLKISSLEMVKTSDTLSKLSITGQVFYSGK